MLDFIKEYKWQLVGAAAVIVLTVIALFVWG